MKASLMGSGLYIAVFVMTLFVSSDAVADNIGSAQSASNPLPVSVDANHPLAMAHQNSSMLKKIIARMILMRFSKIWILPASGFKIPG